MAKHKFSERGVLLRKWLFQAIAWKGSIASVAQLMGVHVHTVSRILAEVDGVYQSNGSKETVRAFQTGFKISEDEYQLGPEHYKKPGVESSFNSDRISMAYQLSKLQENILEIPTPLFVMSFQHLDNWRDFYVVIVDLPDRGLKHGDQVVIHKSKTPLIGDTVLIWDRGTEHSQAHATFIEWSHACPPDNTKTLGVCVSIIG
ncbi:MAG: transposase family protein [Candidatus Hinthialibacter antarcticus]|nr:transposase family protein [Candidatus Hinthialibacter antarcticus]